MPKMKMTIEVEGKDTVVVEVPSLAVDATDEFAQSIGKIDATHLLLRYLLDSLLVSCVLPRTPLPEDVQTEVSLLEAELAAKKAAIEEKRLESFLPVLKIAGQVVTLPQIEAQHAATKENNEN